MLGVPPPPPTHPPTHPHHPPSPSPVPPCRRPVIGFAEDLQRIGRREVQQFFQQHYGPQALTIAVAGDVKPEEVRRLAERYFGGWRQPEGALPPSTCSGSGASGREEGLPVPAAPQGEWRYEAASKAGPGVMQAYYRPCIRSPDAVPLELARWVVCVGGWCVCRHLHCCPRRLWCCM